MKTPLILLCVILFSVSVSAQWSQQVSPTNKNLFDVAFINAQTGYAVGAKGTILKTINGGNDWVEITSPVDKNRDVVSITIVDSSTVLITTSSYKSKAFIYKSKDGGASWRKVLDDTNPFYATTTKSKNLYAVSSQIYKSSDVGKNWNTQQTLNSTSSYSQIEFANNNVGMVGGNISGFLTYSAEFLRTIDGATWYSSYPFSFPNANGFSSFSAISADSVYMYTNFYNRFTRGDSSQLIILTNFRLAGPSGSQQWAFKSTIVGNNLQDKINDMKFFAGRIGYAVSDSGVIYRSSPTDQFKKEYNNAKKSLHAVFMLDTENGFVVGNDGLILKRQPTTITQFSTQSHQPATKPIQAVQ